MAQNKNALIRYRTIDKCLQNHYRKWTLEDLIQACSDALYEYEGKKVNVSRRTVQLDIQLMRSDKLGYNAPIVVYDKKYYRYEDESYSITDIPLTENDMDVLSEAVEMLKQFKDFSLFSELGDIIHRLEDRVYSEKAHRSAIIHLDKNEKLKGLEYLDPVYRAIVKKICLTIEYQPFQAEVSSTFDFHPFILKEFNNRWFIVGRREKEGYILNLALDRIIKLDVNLGVPYLEEEFNGDEFYKNTFGVTVLDDEHLKEIYLKINPQMAPYVLTKPFHHSQELIETYEDKSILIRVKLHLNYEFDRLILGFGETMEVIEPQLLRKKIADRLRKALSLYGEEDFA